MTRARDVSRLVTTPPNIYATDSEASAGFLSLSSASTTYLTQASASTTYATIINAGKILKVVNTYWGSVVATTSTSYVDTNLTASITPSSSSSKILVNVCQTLSPVTSGTTTFGKWRIVRGATEIYKDERVDMYQRFAHNTYSATWLDSPATTSSVTYKTQMATGDGSYVLEAQHADLRWSTITLMEVAV
jgi:hypothetical protein